MKKINAYPRSVFELLNNSKYTIDYYQREFKWKEQQINDLLRDLESTFFNFYDINDDRSEVENYGYYFLGSIVKTIKEGKNFIVDGQQRLTSLTLLFIFLRNLQTEQNRDDLVNIDSMIFSEKFGRKSFNIEDTEDFERNSCMNALFNNEEFDINNKSESIQNIVKSYNYIKDIFSEAIQDNALPYFIEWMMHKVQLIEIIASADEDAYNIFETMNDRGLSLTPVEMLKGYLLANIKDKKDRKEMNLLWKKWIFKLKDIDKEEDSNFIKAWFRAKYANSIREAKKGAVNKDFEKIGTGFHKWFREQEGRLGLNPGSAFKDFIHKEFNRFAKYYYMIRNASKNFTEELEYVYYNAVNNFTLQYPLILAPLKAEDDDDTILKKIQLVSGYIDIFICRRVVNYKTLRYSSILYTMFNMIKEIRDLDLENLVNKLNQSVNELSENFDAVLNFKLHSRNKRFIKPLLARITYYIERKSMIESNYETYISREVRKPFEIEHIWGSNYEQHKDEFSSEEEFMDYRQYLGNLLLIPRGFNQSLGADTYENKVQAYFGQNLLAKSLNKLCYKNNPSFISFIEESHLPFQPHKEFKKIDLDSRQELYRRICEKIWDPTRFNEIIV